MSYFNPSENINMLFLQSIVQKLSLSRSGIILIVVALAVAASPTHAEPTTSIKFGFQPWPGVTIKTEIVSEIVDALGYDVKKTSLATPFIVRGLASEEVDIELGGWYPLTKSVTQPLVDKGKVIQLAANLSHALSGMAVPTYVHEAGVSSMKDLARFADKFDHTIYGIEVGAIWNERVKNIIDENKYKLGDWQVVGSSTPGMMSQVGRATKKGKWIAFYGWEPHWMNIRYDLYYLKAPADSLVAHTDTTVYTFVSASFPERWPNLSKFLRQFSVTTKTQNEWIYQLSYKERPKESVAKEWISSHLDVVGRWLQGVTTMDGEPGMEAVRAVYKD